MLRQRTTRIVLAAGGLALLIALGVALGTPSQGADPLTPQRLDQRFPDAPFATLIDAPPVAMKTGGGSLPISARACSGCHPKHHAEWAASTHAQALADPQFIAELSKPSSPRWLCLNCHIPLQQQRPYRVQADSIVRANAWDVRDLQRVPNADYDPALAREAITCATCHVRRDTDGRGTIIGPKGSPAAPHRVRADPEALNAVCARCHDPGPVQLTGTFLCWFETRREIALGDRKGAQCVTCHMPTVQRAPAIGRPVRAVRAHHWRGGGPGKTYDAPLGQSAARVELTPGKGTLTVTVHNAHAAHRMPTADPERHLRIIVEQAGRTQVERIGQRWDWGDAQAGRTARRVADNRPVAGAAQRFTFAVTDAPLRVRVVHVRLSPDNLAHMQGATLDAELRALAPKAAQQIPVLQQHYPLFRTVYAATVHGGQVTVEADPGAQDAAARGLTVPQLKRLLGE